MGLGEAAIRTSECRGGKKRGISRRDRERESILLCQVSCEVSQSFQRL